MALARWFSRWLLVLASRDAGRRADWMALALALGMALLALAVVPVFMDVTRPHLSGPDGVLNDQVNFVSAARNWAVGGELSSSVTYPATLRQSYHRNFLYPPGHAVVLGLAYRGLGYGPLTSVLPSLLGFLAAVSGAFLIGRRLGGRTTGLMAAGSVIIVPANVMLAWTAMSEMTGMGVMVLSAALVLHLPARLRPFAVPPLVALAALFKDVGPVVALPLVGAFPGPVSRRWLVRALATLAVAAVACLLVLRTDLMTSRPRLNFVQIDERAGLQKYQDALVPSGPAGLAEWSTAVKRNLRRNLAELPRVLAAGPLDTEALSLAEVLLALGLCSWVGWRQRRDAPWFACTALAGWALLGGLLALYSVMYFRAVRALILLEPLLAVGVAHLAAQAVLPSRPVSSRTRWKMAAGLALLAACAIVALRHTAATCASGDRQDDAAVRFIESIGHDDRRTIAGPVWLLASYGFAHHPVRWSFLPQNAETLSLLIERLDVATMLVPVRRHGTNLSQNDLHAAGFRVDAVVGCGPEPCLVLRR